MMMISTIVAALLITSWVSWPLRMFRNLSSVMVRLRLPRFHSHRVLRFILRLHYLRQWFGRLGTFSRRCRRLGRRFDLSPSIPGVRMRALPPSLVDVALRTASLLRSKIR
ncbi:hypothetical protein F4680DRAFT_435086 [Xylaria scruposa]|nr:hypothetical protein F4680DRAFT_435086 [Xylaria scruposa]